jgi:hypothetical protein
MAIKHPASRIMLPSLSKKGEGDKEKENTQAISSKTDSMGDGNRYRNLL